MIKLMQKSINKMCSVVLVFYSTGVLANGITPAAIPNADLINAGRVLFFEETFDGNGRTCGTCHPAGNNFTIDPEFIANLPDDDPLFVAEFMPALMVNFEKPELIKQGRFHLSFYTFSRSAAALAIADFIKS